MAAFMMNNRRNSQGLLLLALLILAFSAILTPINGETMTEGSKAEIIVEDDDVFNGCTPHNAGASRFLCTKDGLYWPSLTECAINCPCKVRCNR